MRCGKLHIMEKIGFIEKEKISLRDGFNSIDRLKNVEIKYADRDLVEERNDVVQLICAGVIMTTDNQILIVNKSKESTGEQSPERNKTLLYIGGHLDISDNSESNMQTFKAGLKREIIEEIGLNIKDDEICSPFVTYTSTPEKSAKHLGIIFPVVIEKSFDVSFIDGKSKFVNISGLSEVENFGSWSEIVLEEIVQKKLI